MKKTLQIILILTITIGLAIGANVKWEKSLSIGDSSLNTNSIFDVISTSKGSRPQPSLTTTQRNNISTPVAGLSLYNSTTNELNLYNNTTWTILANTDQAQTFTNKTIVGTANSISGLRHGTEVDNPTTGAHGVTGTIVGTTDTQSFSNKSILDALSFANISIPASPATGYLKLYSKSDNRFYQLDPSGNEKSISPIFTPNAGSVFVSNGTPDAFTLTAVGTSGQYLRSSGTSPPTWVDIFTFTPSAGNVFYSAGTPNSFSVTTTGTPGQYLQSNGSSAPTWTTVSVSGTPTVDGDDYNQNYVYNGDVDIWNEGTSIVGAGTGEHGAEGFPLNLNSTAVVNINRSTSVPTVSSTVKAFNYSYEIDVTTADASIGAGDTTYITHRVEGNNFKNIHQKQVTLSFWVYATVTGISCVSFRNSANDRSYVEEFTINSSNTWEYKTITLNLDTGGTWVTTAGGIGVNVGWALSVGSSHQATAGVWNASGSKWGTSNQVNHTSSTANYFRITGVKLNLGSSATGFTLMGGDAASELAITQRYFQKSYPADIAPGTSGADGYLWFLGYNISSGLKIHSFPLPVQMCKAPTMTVYDYSGNSGVISTYDVGGTKTDNVAITASIARVTNAYVRLDGSTIYGMLFQYKLNARL